MNNKTHSSIFIVSAALSCLLLSCGPSSKSQDGDSGVTTPGSCTSTIDCLITNQVCDITTNQCTDFVTCSDNDDCGPAAYCKDGLCEPAQTGTPCENNEDCLPGEDCFYDFCGCEGELFATQPIAPNIMLVLDKSGSMFSPRTKWTDAKDAINEITSQFSKNTQFGLTMFPTDGIECQVTTTQVLPAVDSSASISDAMDLTGPAGKTPLYQAVKHVRDNSYLTDDKRDNAMVIVADGDHTCTEGPLGGPASGVIDIAGQMLRANPPVRTYTIGYHFEDGFSFLQDVARAGGTQTVYEADNTAGLISALQSIVSNVVSCTYEVSGNLPTGTDSAGLIVYVDDNETVEDPANGYTYNEATNLLTFHGQSCDNFRNGLASEVTILAGCITVPN